MIEDVETNEEKEERVPAELAVIDGFFDELEAKAPPGRSLSAASPRISKTVGTMSVTSDGPWWTTDRGTRSLPTNTSGTSRSSS